METLILSEAIIQSIQTHLTSAVGSLINKTVNIAIAHHGIVTIPQAHNRVNELNGQVTTVYIPIMGDVVGDIFLFLSGESAVQTADLMIGNTPGTTKVVGEFEMSALKEMGNITSGVIVTDLANNLHLSMMLTTPNLATDMPGALVDQVLVQYGETSNDLLAIDLTFTISDTPITGSFLLLFDKESSDLIREKSQDTVAVASS